MAKLGLFLSATDAEEIATALQMRSNYMQTGTVTLSAADLAQRGDPKQKPKSLDVNQMRKIVQIADLIDRVLKSAAETI